MSGDFIRASNELGFGTNTPKYQSATERIIESGDTLPNLASRYLGDARLWKYLAVFNDLQPPYISQSKLPKTLSVGDKILVPSTARAPEQQASPVVFGVPQSASADEHVLGADFELVDDGVSYDWAVDAESGNSDFKIARGVACLNQGLKLRIVTEKGSAIMYQTLGTARVIGLGLTPVDIETIQIRLVEAIQEDSRVNAVRNVQFQNGPPDDAAFIEMDVEIKGLSRSEKIIVRQ
jgi:hypothetical protein